MVLKRGRASYEGSTAPMEEAKINPAQVMAIFVLVRLQAATIIFPVITATRHPKDAWIAATIGVLLSVPFALMVVKIGLLHPNKSPIQYSRDVLGKWPGTLISLAYIWLFLNIAASVSRELAESYAIAIMPDTPIVIFIGAVAILGSISAKCGLEVIGRMCQNSIYVVLTLLFLTLVLPLNRFKIENLLPIFEKGFAPVLWSSANVLALSGEIIACLMVIPHLNHPREASRAAVQSMSLSGVFVILGAAAIAGIFGPLSDSLVIPSYSQARIIRIGEVFTRLEMMPLAAWTLMAWLKVAFFQWVVMVGIAQLFRLSDYRMLSHPVGFLVASLAVLAYDNVFDEYRFVKPQVWAVYGGGLQVGIAAILYFASLIKGTKDRDQGQSRGPGSEMKDDGN